ncbi:trypsin alpha-3 isoform X2 [Rhipicephalus microplus]|uniref:trypsin alpha-3 isoform X2 n=1 Tax=Rhipicephalus microplus TaxID=6941 RepID=UPI003F6A5484
MLYGASEFSAGTKVIVKHFYRHENFDFQTFKNDLAILWLDEPIKLGPKARTICLPKSPQNLVGKTVVVAGWGVTTENGTGSPVLRYTTQVVWNLEQCIQGLGGIAFYSPQQICAYKRGSDACQGDSGAPLMLKEGDAFQMAGLVSFGNGCNMDGVPGVYTNIVNYRDWIDLTISAYSLSKYEQV